MSVRILSIGVAQPPHSISQVEAARWAVDRCAAGARQQRLVPELFRMTQIKRRASTLIRTDDAGAVDYASVDSFYPPINGDRDTQRGSTTAARMAHYREHAPQLAREAGASALAGARVEADRITHLVTASCTGFAAPGVEFELIRRLGLRRDIKRTHVGFMGCHAAFNGLQVASAASRADRSATVLLCCVELCTLHFQYGFTSSSLVANSLFADGAAAAVIGRAEQPHHRPWTIADTASRLIDHTEDDMTWHITNHGFVMTLSTRVPHLIAAAVRPWIDEWLGHHDLRVQDIQSWAIHPGGPRIISAVAERLDLSDSMVEPSHQVLRECGNMSSATVLFILHRLIAAGARTPCVAMSFGPGLVAEAALLI